MGGRCSLEVLSKRLRVLINRKGSETKVYSQEVRLLQGGDHTDLERGWKKTVRALCLGSQRRAQSSRQPRQQGRITGLT